VPQLPEPIAMAAMLAPVLAVIAVRWVGQGPASASASELGPAPIIPDVTPAPAPPEAIARAAERARALNGKPVSSALLRVEMEPVVERSAPVSTTTSQAQVEPDAPILPPSVTLTAVARGRTGPVALLDDRPRSIGDEVSPGWVIAAIDLKSRRVLLVGPKGTRHVLRLGAHGS
jgi:hypothetical protein